MGPPGKRGSRKASDSETKAKNGKRKESERAAEHSATPLFECRSKPDVRVSVFDHSVENHFKALDSIGKLCGEDDTGISVADGEVARLSSSITFLREWRYFNYEARDIKFATEAGMRSSQEKDAVADITLPQFSSASVPKENGLSAGCNSKDFVMYVGGPVWALDWCPRVHQKPEYEVKNEFIAVATHPPGSSYHKLGAPLTGRGVIQVWSLLSGSGNEQAASLVEQPKQRLTDSRSMKEKSTQPKRPRGRPRKEPSKRPSSGLDCDSQFVHALAIKYPGEMPQSCILNVDSGVTYPHAPQKDFGGSHTNDPPDALPDDPGNKCDMQSKTPDNMIARRCHDGKSATIKTENKDKGLSDKHQLGCNNYTEDHMSDNNFVYNRSSDNSGSSISEDIAMPRLVFCLAHNGKVAWDVKWRPSSVHDTKFAHVMGYLAVLLGNGFLEVWEIPLPQVVKAVYSSTQREGTDPRFIKLEPVFKCSMLNSGGIQSIPLTVEWSASYPHEYLLVGCHDGTVALWKFFANNSSKAARPLLCFSADTLPIRAVAWAPFGSDAESMNVIVTAGHGGIKFWDMRDPFRPLWDLHLAPKNVNSLDWLPDPRCVLLSFDDGTLKFISLSKAAYDGPVTGKLSPATRQGGLHTYYCSCFAIWSVHVSRYTGLVAYGSADGHVFYFQLTPKAVNKDPQRNRAPHFLCMSVTEEESAIVLNMAPSEVPITLGKPQRGTPSSMREFSSETHEVKVTKKNRAEEPNSGMPTLAICYSDYPSLESEWGETLASFKSKKKNRAPQEANEIQSEIETQRDEGEMVLDEKSKESDTKRVLDTFPSKIVAMHRVRWNMNEGSERWLCSGGAAGVLRCQEIDVSSVIGRKFRRK